MVKIRWALLTPFHPPEHDWVVFSSNLKCGVHSSTKIHEGLHKGLMFLECCLLIFEVIR